MCGGDSRFLEEFMSVLHQCTTIHDIARKTFTMHANQTHSEPANCWVYKVAAHTETRVHSLRLSACYRLRSKLRAGKSEREREGSDSPPWLTSIIIRAEHYRPVQLYISLILLRSFLLSHFLTCRVGFLFNSASMPCWQDQLKLCLDVGSCFAMLMSSSRLLKV